MYFKRNSAMTLVHSSHFIGFIELLFFIFVDIPGDITEKEIINVSPMLYRHYRLVCLALGMVPVDDFDGSHLERTTELFKRKLSTEEGNTRDKVLRCLNDLWPFSHNAIHYLKYEEFTPNASKRIYFQLAAF